VNEWCEARRTKRVSVAESPKRRHLFALQLWQLRCLYLQRKEHAAH